MKAAQTSLCLLSRQNPWGRHRGALPCFCGSCGQFLTEQAHFTSRLKEFKEAASHEGEITNEN